MKRLIATSKIVLILSAIFSCGAALASTQVDWNDLEEGGEVSLHQDISLENGPVFKKGERFSVLAYGGISQIASVWMTLRLLDCKAPEAKSEVTVILPEQHEQDPWRNRSVMVELYPDCELLVVIEGADYYTPSLFDR